MSETKFDALFPPSDHGQEFLRAALDDDGQLVLSLRGGPLRSDPRLWGCALGDIALAAARHHVDVEQFGTASHEAAIENDDASDEHEALQAIVNQFGDEMQLAKVDNAPHALCSLKMKSVPARQVAELGKGDRFTCDGQLYIVTKPSDSYLGRPGKPIISVRVEAVNLATGDTVTFEPELEVSAVRFKRE